MTEHSSETSIIETSSYTVNRKEISNQYTVYLSTYVNEPGQYGHLNNFLVNTVNEEDKVTIYLSNWGGDLYSTVSIMNAIKDCPGTVHIEVCAPCYSAATMIALSGDSLVLRPHTFLMIHNYSSSFEGKGGELKAAATNESKLIEGIFKEVYSPFLTKNEIKTILDDKDVYVHWNDSDLDERINRLEGMTSE